MQNRGKQFETHIKEAFQKVPGVSIDRIHDQTNGFKDSTNICDFIVYREPYEFYFECKSIHGNTLPLTNITDNQYRGLLEKSKIPGVFAGVICWWVDKDITLFLSINLLLYLRAGDFKSIPYNIIEKASTIDLCLNGSAIEIKGKKKRVFFDYDMEGFLDEFSVK